MSCRVSCFCEMLLDCSRTFLQENDGGTEGGKTVAGGDVVGSTSVDSGLGGAGSSVLVSAGGHGRSHGSGHRSSHGLDQCAGAIGNSDGGGRGDGVGLAVDGGHVCSSGGSRANGGVSIEEKEVRNKSSVAFQGCTYAVTTSVVYTVPFAGAVPLM